MKPIVYFVLGLAGGFIGTFIVCVVFMASVFGDGPKGDEKVMGMNRAEYKKWSSETATPRVLWISIAGGFICGTLCGIKAIVPSEKK